MTGTIAHFAATLALLFAVNACAADPELIRSYSVQGERALAEKRYDDAAKAYEKLRAIEPGMAEVHARLGLIYFQQRRFTQAVPSLQEALKLKPALPNIGILLAMSLSELGRYTEALPGLERGFRQTGDAALRRMAGLQLQRAYTGLQQDDKAVATAFDVTRAFPNDPEVLYHASRLFGNYAFLTMRRLAEVAPNSVWKTQAAAEVHESQGEYDLAVAAYRQVLAADPQHPGLHFRIGRSLLARSRQPDAKPDLVTQAAEEFRRELQTDPTNANAAYELAEIHRRAERMPDAEQLFETALKYYPDFEEAHVGLSRVLLASGKAAAAADHLNKAVSLNPRSAVAFYQLAQAYRVLGRTADQQKALAEFRRLRAEDRGREGANALFSPREITGQQLDPDAQP